MATSRRPSPAAASATTLRSRASSDLSTASVAVGWVHTSTCGAKNSVCACSPRTGTTASTTRGPGPRACRPTAAAALTALDAACSILPMETSGTLVHARLDPVDDSPDWTLAWSNAGHPPPLLRPPDGHVTKLLEHDAMLHRSLGPFDRTEHRRSLLPGSTLLLSTEGLVEHRGQDMDAAVTQLIALLARHGDRPCVPP